MNLVVGTDLGGVDEPGVVLTRDDSIRISIEAAHMGGTYVEAQLRCA